MNFYTLKSLVSNLPNDNILANVVYKLDNVTTDCIFYNENVSFGFNVNSIKQDIQYIKDNNLTFEGLRMDLVFLSLDNEINECINCMNRLQRFSYFNN